MIEEDRLGVALVKEACPICGKQIEGPILMNQRLTVGEAKKVKELHGKTIGFLKEPCDECKKLGSIGIIAVGIVSEKTDDMKNPYRSGNIWVVTEDYTKRLFAGKESMINEAIKKRAFFIDVKAANEIGFPDCHLNA